MVKRLSGLQWQFWKYEVESQVISQTLIDELQASRVAIPPIPDILQMTYWYCIRTSVLYNAKPGSVEETEESEEAEFADPHLCNNYHVKDLLEPNVWWRGRYVVTYHWFGNWFANSIKGSGEIPRFIIVRLVIDTPRSSLQIVRIPGSLDIIKN